MKRVYKMKKTISAKQFVTEFGEGFSKNMKLRIQELGTRCVFTRKESNDILDLKHVEHIKYDSCRGGQEDSMGGKKEYAYGQFVINEGTMYFSNKCVESDDVMQAPVVSTIYNTLNSEELTLDEGITAKKVDDGNIDYVVDSILQVCPEMSAEHKAIISRY